MSAETIKDFLVSLGFSVDTAGAQKFESVLKGATANAIKMGLAVEGAALSVVAFTAKIASGLDDLYWASQRTGATVQGIKSIGYAVSQVGGSAEAARGSLESLARFVRSNPGSEGFLNRSPKNKQLSLMYNAQSLSSALWGNNVLVIRNKVSGDIISCRSVAFQKQPDYNNPKVAGTVAWVFDCGKIDEILGEY